MKRYVAGERLIRGAIVWPHGPYEIRDSDGLILVEVVGVRSMDEIGKAIGFVVEDTEKGEAVGLTRAILPP